MRRLLPHGAAAVFALRELLLRVRGPGARVSLGLSQHLVYILLRSWG